MITLGSLGGAARPLDIGPTVNLYVCGVTPYDAAHLGHVATFLTYDVLVRRLRHLGHKVRYVRNIELEDLARAILANGNDNSTAAAVLTDLARVLGIDLAVAPAWEGSSAA